MVLPVWARPHDVNEDDACSSTAINAVRRMAQAQVARCRRDGEDQPMGWLGHMQVRIPLGLPRSAPARSNRSSPRPGRGRSASRPSSVVNPACPDASAGSTLPPGRPHGAAGLRFQSRQTPASNIRTCAGRPARWRKPSCVPLSRQPCRSACHSSTLRPRSAATAVGAERSRPDSRHLASPCCAGRWRATGVGARRRDSGRCPGRRSSGGRLPTIRTTGCRHDRGR